MVRDDMLPGEHESVKRVIRDENDWIIWRVKPPGDELGVRVDEDGKYQFN
jgi:hypothetical protein